MRQQLVAASVNCLTSLGSVCGCPIPEGVYALLNRVSQD